MNEFKELGIIEPVLKAIEEKKFEKPTDIQAKSIPLILKKKDVIGGSATGSGKTLAFGAGIIQNTEKCGRIQALIMTPTRELAEQVATELRFFSKYKPLNIVTVYGGVAINPQMEKLRNADVVVGTPGRLLDHLERRTINLNNVNTLVLDEADIMLDMGFIDDVKKITSQCPGKRQTLLYSATIHGPIEVITQKYMKNPVKVSVETKVDPSKLKQIYYDVSANNKLSVLVHLIKEEQQGLVMVFCNTRRYVDVVAKSLKGAGVPATAIHGGLTQAKRSSILEDFHKQKVFVLVCTDVAARGLDIQDVSHIYNYDVPNDPKQYVHRIGRTARAGKEGKAVTILAPMDHENFYRVMREDHELKIEKVPTPKVERVEMKAPSRDGGRGGSRGRFGNRSGGHGGKPRSGGNRSGYSGNRSGASGTRGGRSGPNKPRSHSGGGNRSGPKRSSGPKNRSGRGRR